MKKSTICPVCGKEVRPRYGNERESIYCSRACFLTVRKVPKESRKCLICGKEFIVKVTSLQQCCSKPCAAIRIGLSQRGKKVTSPAFYEVRRKSGATGANISRTAKDLLTRLFGTPEEDRKKKKKKRKSPSSR